jgi:hypothetical protein
MTWSSVVKKDLFINLSTLTKWNIIRRSGMVQLVKTSNGLYMLNRRNELSRVEDIFCSWLAWEPDNCLSFDFSHWMSGEIIMWAWRLRQHVFGFLSVNVHNRLWCSAWGGKCDSMTPRSITSSQDCGRGSWKGEEVVDSANGGFHCHHVAPDARKTIMTFITFHRSLD